MLLLRQIPAGSNEGFLLLLLTLCLLLPALDLHVPLDDPVSILSTRHDLLPRLKRGDALRGTAKIGSWPPSLANE